MEGIALDALKDGASLKPAFDSKGTAVVLMSDSSHALTMSVCLESILRNSSKSNEYDIVVLDIGLTAADVHSLLGQVSPASNVSLRFVDVKKDFVEARIATLEHKSASCFACAWIADHMEKYCEVLYLGANVVCTVDVADILFDQVDDWCKMGVGICDNAISVEPFPSVSGDVFTVKSKALACKMQGELNVQSYSASRERNEGISDLIKFIPCERVKCIGADLICGAHETGACDPPAFVQFEGISLPCFHPISSRAQLFWKYARTSPCYEKLLALSSWSSVSGTRELTKVRTELRIGPLVSIIMPVYNSESFLRESIDSILGQTYWNIELICVNDGSKDKSADILHQYELADPRVVVIDKENSGAGKTRNLGMKYANGSYMCFVDSDDFLEPYAIERLVDVAEENMTDVVIFKMDQYDNVSGEFTPSNWAVSRPHILPRKVFYPASIDNFYKHLVGFTVNKLYRSSFLLKLDLEFPSIGAHEDMPFTYIALSAAEKAYYLDETLYHYRRSREGSLSDTTSKRYVYMFDALAHLEKGLKDRCLWNNYQRHFVNYVLHMCVWKYNELGTYRRHEFKDACRTTWFDRFGVLDCDEDFFFDKVEYCFIGEAMNMPFSDRLIAQLVRFKDAHVGQSN